MTIGVQLHEPSSKRHDEHIQREIFPTLEDRQPACNGECRMSGLFTDMAEAEWYVGGDMADRKP
jgi:hypothetical protein